MGVLPCFHARILPHFQVKPSPTLRFNAEIWTTLYYSVIIITSTTIINLLQPPLHGSVIESLFEINYLVLSRREGVTIFCTQSIDCCRDFSFATENRYINTSNLTPILTTPNQFMHNMSKIKTNIPARGTATHVKTIRLRWPNTVYFWVYVICQIMARERLQLTSWNLASVYDICRLQTAWGSKTVNWMKPKVS